MKTEVRRCSFFATSIVASVVGIAGAALVVKGLSISSTGEGADASLAIDQVTFTDQGDGSVAVTTSDRHSAFRSGK